MPPRIGFETGIAALTRGRHVGEERIARLSGLRERAEIPGFDLRHRQGGTPDQQIDMPSERVGHRRSAAAIRPMHEFHAGAVRQQHHRQMTNAAASNRGIADAAGFLLGGGNDIGQRIERFCFRRRDQIGRRADEQTGSRSLSLS
jgi:predicted transcriptional regulator